MRETMRLGVLSDTHVGSLATSVALASHLLDGPFAGVDAILHCGDMVTPDFDAAFGELPFYAVLGNMDRAQPGLPVKRILTLAGFRIGMVHGWGAPDLVPRRVLTEFAGADLDLILFGHSHKPYLKRHGRTLLFNPGSAVDHRGHHPFCTVGLIELGEGIHARHLRFDIPVDG